MWHSESRRRSAGAARRPLIVAAIVGGAVLQRILVAPTAPPTSPTAQHGPRMHVQAPPLAPGAARPVKTVVPH